MNLQSGPASQLVAKVTEWENGYLLNWRDQTLPEGVDEKVLFQRWKGDGTWADAGRSVDWFPKDVALVYRAQGCKSPDEALTELFPSLLSNRPKKRDRLPSPDVEIVSGEGAFVRTSLIADWRLRIPARFISGEKKRYMSSQCLIFPKLTSQHASGCRRSFCLKIAIDYFQGSMYLSCYESLVY